MKQFKRVLAGLLALGAVLVGVTLLWALAEPYFLDEQEHVAAIPDLPPTWAEQRFALMADWQVGMWGANVSTIRRAVGRLVEERPAFVLIAGDFVYQTAVGDVEEIKKAAGLVRPLTEAGIPVYAVLGNHDYGMQTPDDVPDAQLARHVEAVLRAADVRVLDNEAVALRPPGIRSSDSEEALYLVGVGPSWPGGAAVPEALADVPEGAPRLIVMHNPNAFAAFPAGTAPLAVAGHTHGGQVRLPHAPEWSWMTYFKSNAVHTDGWVAEGYGQAKNRLYVNRGIGFSLVPFRLNAMPEVTHFVLRPR